MLIISEDLAKDIHMYLITKPMTEVESLVLGIRALRKVEVIDDKNSKKELGSSD